MFNKSTLTLFTICLLPTLSFADGVGTAGLSQFQQTTGKGIYEAVCQSCHMADGKGAIGAGHYPSLVDNINLTSAAFTTYTIMYGRKAMPGIGGKLDDEQIATIVNYLRQNFGNNYQDTVTSDQIKAMRKPDYEYPDVD